MARVGEQFRELFSDAIGFEGSSSQPYSQDSPQSTESCSRFRMVWPVSAILSFVAGIWAELIRSKPRDLIPSREWLEEYSDLGIYDSTMGVEESFEKCLEESGNLVASTVVVDNNELIPTPKSKIKPYAFLLIKVN